MPETEESATDFVIGGDTRLMACASRARREAEESGDGMAWRTPTWTWPTPASTTPCRARRR
jgi:hypothetical protein